MTNLSPVSPVTGFSAWWNDRKFTNRQGGVNAALLSAISLSAIFALCVFFSG
jgi:hypothetical protein